MAAADTAGGGSAAGGACVGACAAACAECDQLDPAVAVAKAKFGIAEVELDRLRWWRGAPAGPRAGTPAPAEPAPAALKPGNGAGRPARSLLAGRGGRRAAAAAAAAMGLVVGLEEEDEEASEAG